MNCDCTNATGRVLPRTFYQMHRLSIALGIVLMILLPGFLIYCALATESTFWGCIVTAVIWLFVFALFLVQTLKDTWLTKMTFVCNEQFALNQTARGINRIHFNEEFYTLETNIPFYIGKGKMELSYLMYTKTKENLSAFEGYSGLNALKHLYEIGAVLVPKEVFATAIEK